MALPHAEILREITVPAPVAEPDHLAETGLTFWTHVSGEAAQDAELPTGFIRTHFDIARGDLQVLGNDWTAVHTLSLAEPDDRRTALELLANISVAPARLGTINPAAEGAQDQRSEAQRAFERAVAPYLPYNLREATAETIAPSGEPPVPELADHIRSSLFHQVAEQSRKFAKAETVRTNLLSQSREPGDAKAKAADNVPTVDKVLREMDEDVSLSLRILSGGNRGRLIQLVSEHQSLEKVAEERMRMLRAVGEYSLMYQEGVTKSALILSHYRDADPATVLTAEQRKAARDGVSPQFADAAERYAAATELANRELMTRGAEQFSMETFRMATDLHERGVESANVPSRLRYDGLSLRDGQLTSDTMQTMEGRPFTWWQELPVVPLLMKKDKFRMGTPDQSLTTEQVAENIMQLLESNQISNHGRHVAISEDVRAKIVEQIHGSVRAGQPVKLEMYYTMARMANPLEGVRRTPGHQDWAMMYKLAQVSETVGLFYRPEQDLPPVQWVIIDEAQAFADVWDLDPQETAAFRDELRAMLTRMGHSDTVIFDDLLRMAEEHRADVWPMVDDNYRRILGNWERFVASGQTWEDYQQTMGEALDKTARGDIQTILDRDTSMRRLINPLRSITDAPEFVPQNQQTDRSGMTMRERINRLAADYRRYMRVPDMGQLTESDMAGYPDMTMEDMLAVYNGIMPGAELESSDMTPDQERIALFVALRALDANIYSKAVMDARTKMNRQYPEAVSVTITDKTDKLVVFPADPRTKAFMGHGESIVRFTKGSNPGSPEPMKAWYDVDRALVVFAQTTEYYGRTTHRHVGIVDPTEASGIPYAYLEVPHMPTSN